MTFYVRSLCLLGTSAMLVVAAFVTRGATAQEVRKSESKKPVASKPNTDQEFVRLLKSDKNKPVALQTAVTTYVAANGRAEGLQVALIGAIHIGEKAYYAELNKRFKEYDAVLYEMVADPNQVPTKASEAGSRSAVSSLQMGMKDLLGLAFQLDEINYRAKNFVHADMNPEEFADSMKNRQEGMLQILMRSMGSGLALQGSGKANDLGMITAFFSSNRELALKRALAEQFELLGGQMAAIEGDDGKSTLITERNSKALDVLRGQIKAGKTNLAIFYGAGHFKHMDVELRNEFKLRPTKVEWLDAWDLR